MGITYRTPYGRITFRVHKRAGDCLDHSTEDVILEPRSAREERRRVGRLHVGPDGVLEAVGIDGGYADPLSFDRAAEWFAWRELPEAEKREHEYLAAILDD